VKQKDLTLNGKNLNISRLVSFISRQHSQLLISKQALKFNEQTYKFLESALDKNNKVIYGINTGFGPMANYLLAHDQIVDLQQNLILSHAVGMGEKIPDEFVLAAMLVRLNTLVKGYSGVSSTLLTHLQTFINYKIIPIVPEHGAVGTSGDLVQLAHIALALIGKGEVIYNNQRQKASAVLRKLNIKPYFLKPKEGLSLINGTSMMTGIGAMVCADADKLLNLAILNGSLALEILHGYEDSFSQKLHELRPHPGQTEIAKIMRANLKNSKLIRNRETLNTSANHGNHVNKINDSVQEFYSMRCLAQVLGPVYDTLRSTKATVEIEMNSVTDNPIVDSENKKFLHGGNFHGDYVAVAMDQLKICVVKLTMLSERRLNFFLNHKINDIFPPFLNLDTPGLTLGLQGLQFVATSTTANSQTLAYPMNLHSISTNGDNQDIVSMGTDAALLTNKVTENAFIVLAIESLGLCQAVDFLNIKNKLSKKSQALYSFIRNNVPKIVEDRELNKQLDTLVKNLKK